MLSHAPAPRLERVIGVGGLAASAVNCIVGSGHLWIAGISGRDVGAGGGSRVSGLRRAGDLIGLCLAEAGSRVSHAGGLYAYATEAFGPVVGGIAGTLLWAANSVASSAAVANLLVDTAALAIPAAGAGVWRAVLLVTLYASLAAVNIRGARSGARLSVVLAMVKVVPLVLLVAAGAFAVQLSNLQWVGLPAASQVGQTAVLLFFAFIGVEGALNVSGEVANPARTVPRAIFCADAHGCALHRTAAAAQGVLGPALPGAPAPLVATATAVFGPWGTRLLHGDDVSLGGRLSDPNKISQHREFARRCEAAARADARVLRVLRLAFVRAWPLDARTARARVS